jgi:nitrate reductase gamma subunit
LPATASRLTLVRATNTRLDDYLSWTLVILPVITGLLAFYHLVEPYPMVLAVHVLSADLLLMCLPFTKLAHTGLVFFSRAMCGAFYGRRGVSI